LNTTLPQAGPRQGISGQSFGSSAFDNGTTQLAAWLQTHRGPNSRWDLVVTSAQNASTLIAAGNLSVLPLGGFSGNDPTITPAQFADLVAKGEVNYVLASGAGPGGPIGGFGQPRGGSGTPPAFGGNNPSPFVPPSGSRQPGIPNTAPIIPRASAAPIQTPGANSVMSAVRGACTLVPRTEAPAQYYGSLYDCTGAATALRGG
jgi:hypothetical protein